MFKNLSEAPEMVQLIFKDKKTFLSALGCFLYFVISIYGWSEYEDMLFWLNISQGIKVVLYYFSILPLFMGFMISFILPFAIWQTLVYLLTK